jgi:hypothetical protein
VQPTPLAYQAPWSGLTAKARRLFIIAERIGQCDTCKETLTSYNKEIKEAKCSSWRRYCQEITDVPSSARLTKIMAQQATNRVSTIELPDGQCTQTGGETLRELFRVHFPDSTLIIRMMGQAQQNLDVCQCKTNRGHRDLARNIINH